MQKLAIITFALFWSVLWATSVAAQTAVTTYHYDNLRTGWNQQERTLAATSFPQNFGLLQTVDLDDQVEGGDDLGADGARRIGAAGGEGRSADGNEASVRINVKHRDRVRTRIHGEQ